MSKTFHDWSLDQALLLPPSVRDFLPAGHLSRFVVTLVTEELDLSAIMASYKGERGQPPYHPAMMVSLLCGRHLFLAQDHQGVRGASGFDGDRGAASSRLPHRFRAAVILRGYQRWSYRF
jgi:hypothetical protein